MKTRLLCILQCKHIKKTRANCCSYLGFTLLELLVVIAIVGLLATFILIATQESRNKGRYNQVLQQLHQIEFALQLYISNNYNYIWPDAVNTGRQHVDYMVTGNYPVGTAQSVKDVFLGFNKYLGSPPATPMQGGWYAYSTPAITNPANAATYNCPDSVVGAGINIRIGADPASLAAAQYDDFYKLFQYLDNNYDGSDGVLCGKVRFRALVSDPEIYWILAPDRNSLKFD